MVYIVIVIALLVLAVGWHIIRSMAHRSYSKGYTENTGKVSTGKKQKKPKKPKKWELKSDGHIEAEEAVYAEQMQTRYEYYMKYRKEPPELRHEGDTLVASDDFDAAQSVIEEFKALSAGHKGEHLHALAVIKEFNYRNVWYLHGISDYAKSGIFYEAEDKTVYLANYRVLVVKAGDIEGLRREYAVFEGSK